MVNKIKNYRIDLFAIFTKILNYETQLISVNVCLDTATLPVSPAIQALDANGLFHMNQPENGIPIPTPGSHPAYDAKVRARLTIIFNNNMGNINALNTAVLNLITEIKNLFLAHPTFSAQQIAPLF